MPVAPFSAQERAVMVKATVTLPEEHKHQLPQRLAVLLRQKVAMAEWARVAMLVVTLSVMAAAVAAATRVARAELVAA